MACSSLLRSLAAFVPLSLALPAQRPAAFADLSSLVLAEGERIEAVADLDGDGDLDLVTGTDGTNVRWNDGSGRFGPAQVVDAAPQLHAGTIAVGDVDGDGDGDILLGRDSARLLRNDGAGAFTDVSATNMPAGLGALRRPLLADVDNDGDLDVYYAKDFQDRLLRNDGTGVFTDVTATSLPTEGAQEIPVAAVDIDGDGWVDLVSTQAGNGRILRNQGAGVFVDESGTRLPATVNPCRLVTVGDVDGDGDLDLVQVAVTPGTAVPDRFLVNDGTGVFGTAARLRPVAAEDLRRLELVDLDGDGDLDALELSNDARLRVALQGAGNQWAAAPDFVQGAVRDRVREIVVLDIDADADRDVVIQFGDFGFSNSTLLRNDAGRNLVDEGVAWDRLAVKLSGSFDADGDGDPDLLIAAHGTETRLVVNEGGDRWRRGPLLVTRTANSVVPDLVPGDIDGDGDLDLLIVSGGWLVNDGLGNFAPAAVSGFVPVMFASGLQTALADFDLDGDLDVFRNEGPAVMQNRIYLNDGSGNFTDATAAWQPGGNGIHQPLAADYDGDGDADVLLRGGVGLNGLPPVRLLRNDLGVFTPVPLPGGITGGGDRQFLLDLEGDGDLDLVAVDTIVNVFENRGGAFVDVTAVVVPVQPPAPDRVLFGDLDGNGFVDVLLGGATMRVLLNYGGLFLEPPFAIGDVGPGARLVDIDGDGDADLLDESRVWTNLERHLAPRSAPQRGRTWSLDVALQPGYATSLGLAVVSLDVAVLAQPVVLPIGQWYLAAPVTLAILAVPAPAGTAVVSAALPADPALRGIEVFVQGAALQGFPPVLGLLPFSRVRVQ